MSVELSERPESPEVSENRDGRAVVSFKYNFDGSNNYQEIRTAALILTPPTVPYGGGILGRSDVKMRFLPGSWGYVDIEYSSTTTAGDAIPSEGVPGGGGPGTGDPPTFPAPTDGEVLGANWSLSTRGGTVNVKLAKEVMSSTRVGAGAPEPGIAGPVGQDKDGIKGVDVPAMKLVFSITIPTHLKLPLIRTLARIDEPRTNSKPWLGFAAGEVLYVGCEAQGADGSGRASLALHFEGGENLVAGDPRLVIPILMTIQELTIPAKKAHEYLDVRYRKMDGTEGTIVSVPEDAHVYRMFDEMNFSSVFGFG